MRAVVLSGGRSSEHDVSLASGRTVSAALRAGGHDVAEILIERGGVWRCDGEEVALQAGRGLLGADVAFPILHGPYGEDGTVQGLLECLAVPYVGAGVAASAICIDKLLFKEQMARHGLPQVDYEGVLLDRWRSDRMGVLGSLERLGSPVFVKPARLGSSVGISRVGPGDDLAAALDIAFAHDGRVIVEAAAVGAEVECSVIGGLTGARASIPGEIVLTGATADGGWYDYEAKYTPGGMRLVIPAGVAERAREKVRELAAEAFVRAGCSGLARADFFVDGETMLVNELNTMPGFTETSVFGRLWAESGLAYGELLERLSEFALERFESERRFAY
jgi:D-alanine-D-alanine ligase